MWAYSDQWAAGFFDGEGCVTTRQRDKRRVREVMTQITQKDRRPLDEIKKHWGGGISLDKVSGCWRWRTSHKKAEAFLRAIQPYCLVKADKIAEAIALREACRGYTSRT